MATVSPHPVESPERPRRELDFRDLVDVWYRRRFLILSLILLTMVGMEFANWVVYPVFESKVKVLIEGPVGLEIPFSREKLVFKKSEITQTQSEVFISEPNLAEVVELLDLDERPKYTGGLRDVFHKFKDDVIDFYRNTRESVKEFVVADVFGGRYTPPRKPTPFESSVAHLQGSATLRVEPLSNTDLIVASVRDRDPDYAAAIANRLAEVFARRELDARRERARAIGDSINERLAIIEPQMQASRQAIARFKEENDVVDLDGQIDSALQEKSLLEMTYWDISQKESVRELSTWEALQRKMSARQDLTQREKVSLIQKLSDLAELEATYQPDHPKVVAARAAVEEVRRQLKLDEAGEVDNPAPDADADSLKQALSAQIQRLKNNLADLSRLDTHYQELVWDQEHVGDVFKFLIGKREDASIAEQTTQSQARIVEPAQVQYTPIRPRKWLNRGLAFLTSLAVAVGLVALLEYLDRTVRTPEGVARLVGLPTLGSVPYSPR